MSDAETRIRFVFWQQGQHWLGHLVDYPDYLTQGDTREDLEESLRDLYRDLTSGEVEGLRRVDELVVA